MKTKISAAFVIGYDGSDHVIYHDGEVVYDNDRIEFVGHNYPHEVDNTIDAGLSIISPGFIDLDALLDIDHAILDTWVTPEIDAGLQWSADYFHQQRHDLFSREEERFRRQYGMSQLALNGITTFMPIAGEQNKRWCETYDEFADVVDLVGEFGLRAYLGPSYRAGVNVAHSDGRRDVLWDEAEGAQGLADAVRFVQDFDGAHNGLVTGCLLPARIETMTLDLLKQTRDSAESLNCLIRLHCLQGENERSLIQQQHNKTPLQLLTELDLLSSRLLIPHAIMLDHTRNPEHAAADLALLAKTGTSVVHCPLIMARIGRALDSFHRYQDAGVCLALGTDTHPPDMIRVMQIGLHAAHWASGDSHTHQAADFYRAATLGGAAALGRDDIGRLAPGAKADIVVIDLSDYRLGPIDDPIRTLVMMGNGRNVRDVIVDGKPVVTNGVIPGLDENAMRLRAQAYHDKMRASYSQRDFRQRPEEELFTGSFRQIK